MSSRCPAPGIDNGSAIQHGDQPTDTSQLVDWICDCIAMADFAARSGNVALYHDAVDELGVLFSECRSHRHDRNRYEQELPGTGPNDNTRMPSRGNSATLAFGTHTLLCSTDADARTLYCSIETTVSLDCAGWE